MKEPNAGNLRAVNLNLAPVLRALLRHGSVVGAAREVGLSESATSTCLARLRILLGDPLLVKIGRGMKLTPQAVAMTAAVEEACLQIGALFQPARFDPAGAVHTFVVATPDYIGLLISAHLLGRLADLAPGVSVQFVDVPADLPRQLASGGVDIAIVATDRLEWKEFNAAPPVEDDLVVVVGPDHPLAARERLTPDDIGKWCRATFHPGLGRGDYGDGRTSRLLVQQFTILPLLALESDIAAIAPRSLADRMARHLPLRIMTLPYATPVLAASVIWSPVREAEPAHRWFRTLADEALHASIGQRPRPVPAPPA